MRRLIAVDDTLSLERFAVKWFDCTDDTGSGATSWYAYDA
jgi:hypothetical protein